MRKMKKILAMLLALMMVLQMAPVISAEGAAEDVAAVYVSNPSSISASAVGYYWDATNIYYADGAEVKSYSLAAQGINLTDYNQVHAANIDGKTVNVQFVPAKGEAIARYAADNNNQMYIGGFEGFFADGSSLVYDTSVDATDGYASSRSFDVVSHDKDLYLEQTMKFDALPVKAAADHGVFVAMSVKAQGFYFVLSNRIDGTEYIMHATIQNEGDGSLAMYIYYSTETDIRWGSAYGNSGIKLGVNVGEEFVLGTQWNADNSVDIYVNNSYVGGVSNGTRRASGQIGGGNFYNCYYGNLEGDAKFTISNAAIYNGIPKSIAADTASATLEEIVAAANLGVVTGNVALPAAITYAHGAMPITWTTSDASVITADGKVTVAKEDKTATLTASAVGQTVEVNVTVPGSNSYVADYAADISAVTKTGYYWDAQNLYYYNGQLATYALADLGIALTDYNQSVKATIGGKTMTFLFAPSKGAPIATFAADDNTMYVPGWIGFAADGANIVYDSSVATGVECSADSRSNVAVNHANDLYLEQTFKFDALPVKGVPTNGVFIGNSVLGNGFTFYMGVRPNATNAGYSDTFVASIQNEGDGALAIYIANQNTDSAHGSSAIALGVNVGEEFVLGTQWNADGSADIYVNDSYITSVTNATRELRWAVGTGNFYGVRYNNLPGDTKFTISDVAVYNGIVTSVAEDNAVATLAELVAALDLSAVKGDIDLPTQVTYAHGAMPITWTSSDPAVISTSGKVTASKVDTTVTLTATCGGQTASVVATVLADLDEVAAVYTANIAAETATGYYWDAQNLYYYDSALSTYALADLGVTVSDYNQTNIIDVNGEMIRVHFAVKTSASLLETMNPIHSHYIASQNGWTRDDETNTLVFDSAAGAYGAINHNARQPVLNFHETNNIFAEQTINIEKMPEISNYTYNGMDGLGYLFHFDDRIGYWEIPAVLGAIVNEGGELVLYIGESTNGLKLNKGLNETFKLGIQWNVDNSADVYVDNIYMCTYENATVTLGALGGWSMHHKVNAATGDVKLTVSNVIYRNPIPKAIAEDAVVESFADIIAALDLSAVNANVALPTQVTYGYGAMPINWTSSNPEILTADGKLVAVPEKDTAVTLTATYMGQSVDVVATVLCGNVAAGNDFTNILPMHATEGYGTPQVKNNVIIDGATIVYDNETTIDESVTVTNTEAPNADIHYYSRPDYVDHTKYDILLEQTVCIEALPVNPNQTSVFVGNALTARGMLIYMSDRYDAAAGAEHAMLASIQNMGDGKLAIFFANNNWQSAGSADWMMLDKNLGDTFVLGILWKKDDTAVVYVDGIEIGVVANVNRPYNYKGTDIAGIMYDNSYLPGDVKFTVTDFTLYTMGNLAAVGETAYNNLQAALNAAAEGETVIVNDNVYTADLMIPAGVTLDINGNVVHADNIISFGDVVDNATEANGAVTVSGSLQLAADNAQLPVCNSESGYYYFGDAAVKTIGTKASADKVTFGFGPQFDRAFLYNVMSVTAEDNADADCGLTVRITLDWTGNNGDALAFEMSQELIRQYGALAYKYNARGLVAAMMLNVAGVDTLDVGSNVIVDVSVISDTGVVMNMDTMYYEYVG